MDRVTEGAEDHAPLRLRFVVQQHTARSLHYDFRLEMEGVLKSWALPKGAPQKPSDRRLAILTEDHSLDFADFEGTIPEAEYGAGTVVIWDKGAYQVEGPMAAAEQFERGEIRFSLAGIKLQGRFVLLRPRSAKWRAASSKDRWLLIKERDD